MAKIPQPGELIHSVEIQTFTSTGRDAHGQPTGTWATVATRYARIEGLGGRAVEAARQLVNTATHRVAMRYTPHLTRSARIKFGSRILAVGYVENVDERNVWHLATCTEAI